LVIDSGGGGGGLLLIFALIENKNVLSQNQNGILSSSNIDKFQFKNKNSALRLFLFKYHPEE
jgi:hypothetical protein